MRFLAALIALGLLVSAPTPASAEQPNQAQMAKEFNTNTRVVSDHWLKVKFDPRDRRRGSPSDMPPGLERDQGSPAQVNPKEVQIDTREVGEMQFDVKQSHLTTPGNLPPGLDRDTGALNASDAAGVDPLGASVRLRNRDKPSDAPKVRPLRPLSDRVGPAAAIGSRDPSRPMPIQGVQPGRGYNPGVRW